MTKGKRGKKKEVEERVEFEDLPEEQPAKTPEEAFVVQYDVSSTERYVDSTSRKTDFDRVLDELSRIGKETVEWDVLRWTQKHFDDTEEERNRKLESYFGSLIVHAAQELYDRGLGDAAFRKLEQAGSVLQAKGKLAAEVEAIKARSDDTFDVSDLLGFFDGPSDFQGE